MGIYFNSDINTLFVGSTAVSAVYLGDTQVWPDESLEVGTVFNFEYTGTVQSVELPKGKYKLQCWGAQGGTSYGSSSGAGSKGGYSEGVLTLTQKTTLYVFVGGQGSRGSSSSLVNGGWNGGGASVGYSSYSSGSDYGESYPACGGGATDISTVTSSMSYSSGRTNRSSASLLARCIVAGGGAGGSYYYSEYEETSSYDTVVASGSGVVQSLGWDSKYPYNTTRITTASLEAGVKYTASADLSGRVSIEYTLNGTKYFYVNSHTPSANITTASFYFYTTDESLVGETVNIEVTGTYTTTDSDSSSGYSNKSQQGGGTSGRGQYPGTQSAGGNGNGNDGGFGYGGNQSATGYMFLSGGAGGGWYGGGTARSDSSTSYINYSGGGSGFVNTAANSSYRPSGYTGLQLDSGTTTAGNTSHPSTSGGTETGHSGNGYAKITVLDSSGSGGSSGGSTSANITWATQSGTWNSSSNSSAKDGVQYTCVSPGHSGETVIRCTFSGITSITFNCVYNGENNYDYLTVGSLDTACTRTSYGTSLKGSTGTARDITFNCDTGSHYVEFCYSKDSSVDTSPDNATVYIKSYS